MTLDKATIMKALLEQWPDLQRFSMDIETKVVDQGVVLALVIIKRQNVPVAAIPVAVHEGKPRPPAVIITKAGPLPIMSSIIRDLAGTQQFRVANPPKPQEEQTPTNPMAGYNNIIPYQQNPMMGMVRRASAKFDGSHTIKIVYKDSKGWHLQQSILGPQGYMKRVWKLKPKQLAMIPARVKERVLKDGYAVLQLKRGVKMDKFLSKLGSAPLVATYQHLDLTTLKPKKDYVKLSREGWMLSKKAGSPKSPAVFRYPSDEYVVLLNNKYASQPVAIRAHYTTEEVGKDEVYELHNGTKAFQLWLSPIYKEASVVNGVILSDPDNIQLVPINPNKIIESSGNPKRIMELTKVSSDIWELDWFGKGTYGDAISFYEWFKNSPVPLNKQAAEVAVPEEDAQAAQAPVQQQATPQEQSQEQPAPEQMQPQAVQAVQSTAQPLARFSDAIEHLLAKIQETPTKSIFIKLLRLAAMLYIKVSLSKDLNDDAVEELANAVINLGKLAKVIVPA